MKKVRTDIRREQIADAALRIIARKGVSGLTTAALAREAGISEANLYRHFRSKDEILSETVAKISRGLGRNIGKARIEGTAGPALAALKKVFALHLEYVERNEGIPRLVFSEELHAGNEALRERLLDSIMSYSGELERIIRRAQSEGQVRKTVQPGAAALMLIGMIQITIVRWSLSGFTLGLRAEGMKLWRQFEKYLRT